MDDRTGIILGVLLFGLILTDIVLFGSQNLIFLGKKLVDLIEYLAFWR